MMDMASLILIRLQLLFSATLTIQIALVRIHDTSQHQSFNDLYRLTSSHVCWLSPPPVGCRLLTPPRRVRR